MRDGNASAKRAVNGQTRPERQRRREERRRTRAARSEIPPVLSQERAERVKRLLQRFRREIRRWLTGYVGKLDPSELDHILVSDFLEELDDAENG